MQCPAVRIHLSFITLPPQKKLFVVVLRKETMYGNSPVVAFVPFTIRPSILTDPPFDINVSLFATNK